ncbi:MAG: hypothetical protein QM723_25990 [Myxococcaceae bacterium]
MRNLTFVVTLLAVATAAHAQTAEQLMKRERCAVRLSVAITGKSPTYDLMNSPDPQAQADALLSTVDFTERFSRFINTQFNRTPGATDEQDSAYYLAYKILNEGRQWRDLFVGPYTVQTNGAGVVTVIDDPNGLGYFRSPAWMKRYAGNEMAGIKLSTAYRIYNNTIGLHLVPSTNAAGADISASGRHSSGCSGCHYDSMYGLDTTASILSKRNGTGDTMTFDPPAASEATILGGITVHDDKELVTALVNSESFNFRTCRLAFQFLYGRTENRCEGPVFDACMKEFRSQGTVQAALAAVVKDPTFCQ